MLLIRAYHRDGGIDNSIWYPKTKVMLIGCIVKSKLVCAFITFELSVLKSIRRKMSVFKSISVKCIVHLPTSSYRPSMFLKKRNHPISCTSLHEIQMQKSMLSFSLMNAGSGELYEPTQVEVFQWSFTDSLNILSLLWSRLWDFLFFN